MLVQFGSVFEPLDLCALYFVVAVACVMGGAMPATAEEIHKVGIDDVLQAMRQRPRERERDEEQCHRAHEKYAADATDAAPALQS